MKKLLALLLTLAVISCLLPDLCEEATAQTGGDTVVFDFPGGFVTTESTTIETDDFIFEIDANVFVPNDLAESVNRVTEALEMVTGWSFDGNPKYVTGKARAHVLKENSDNEFATAYAESAQITVSPGDLLELFAIIHESTHHLQYRQSPYAYCQWAMEGVSTYTTHKVNAFLLEQYPDMASKLMPFGQDDCNYCIDDFELLYEHPMEYWVDNVFTGCGNNNYGIGYCLMTFLDEQYGDYTKWVTIQEENQPCYKDWSHTILTAEEQTTIFRNVYGEDVFDRFYEWLHENEDRFRFNYLESVDMSNIKQYNCMPQFYYEDYRYKFRLSNFFPVQYEDLLIGIEDGKLYLSEYKSRPIDHLELTLNEGMKVELYDKDGTMLDSFVSKWDDTIDVTNVSVIRFPGQGILSQFSITGFN